MGGTGHQVPIFKGNCAGSGANHSANGAEQCALAGAVGADDRYDFTLLDVERHIVQGLYSAVEDVYFFDIKHASCA